MANRLGTMPNPACTAARVALVAASAWPETIRHHNPLSFQFKLHETHYAILLKSNSLVVVAKGIEMDKLSPLFARFVPTARFFYSGNVCRAKDYLESDGVGHLHLLRSGQMSVSSRATGSLTSDLLTIDQPSVLFYPRPRNHRLLPGEGGGANLLCATVDLGSEKRNPLAMALPDVVVVPLHEMVAIAPTLDLLFAEAFAARDGRQAALDRLIEYFLILLLRHVIDSKMLNAGILTALNDAHLSRSIAAMHERPEQAWSLETLAGEAGMSRARFAARFRETVGTTPLEYLTDWRLCIVQTLLRRGKSIKAIALSVGYRSPAALRRVFMKKLGVSPGEWLSKMNAEG